MDCLAGGWRPLGAVDPTLALPLALRWGRGSLAGRTATIVQPHPVHEIGSSPQVGAGARRRGRP